jgi:YceI-like domain
MAKKLLAAFLFLVLPAAARADGLWVLDQSTLTYHVSHPLHEADGVSHAAKGKGICHAGECNFLIAVPVKSFDSGNSNRDLHMLQVTLGADFPLAIVRFRVPESELASPTIHADLEIQFAGVTAHYKQVVFQRVAKGNDTEVTGTIPLQLSDFKIKPPELLAIPMKNDVPVRVDTTWRPM